MQGFNEVYKKLLAEEEARGKPRGFGQEEELEDYFLGAETEEELLLLDDDQLEEVISSSLKGSQAQ